MQKLFVFILYVLIALGSLRAQTPCTWTFSARKLYDRMYEIHCVADIQAPWHTYSQFTPSGGPLPTKFTVNKNPLFSTDNEIEEKGKMIVKHEDVFGVDVKYFEGKVDFVQLVKLKGNAKTNFSGSVEYMVCNDRQCLPPVTKKFDVVLN
jgi:hypothetical protein